MTLRDRVVKAWDGIDAHGRDTATGWLVPARILNLIRPDEWLGPGELSGPWTDISHAPKDGTPVDLWVTNDEGGFRVTDARWTRPVGLNDETWCIIEPDFGWNYVSYPDNKGERITHYMSIPADPGETK